MDELTSSDHIQLFASRVILWYEFIHLTCYRLPDQVTIVIMCISQYHLHSRAFDFSWELFNNLPSAFPMDDMDTNHLGILLQDINK